MANAPYVGSDVPAEIVVTDGVTTLFQYAQQKLGDALQWWRLADLNGMSDPWVGFGVSLAIPRTVAGNGDGLPG